MKILIVDDSALSRRMIREDLIDGGYEIEEAVSGEDALAKVSAAPPDLITMDVTMGAMSGYETVMLLRQQQRVSETTRSSQDMIPVVFITAKDSVEEREKGFEAGGTEFITKPFIKGTLLKKVNDLLRPAQPYRGIKVLVVDDSAVARMTLSEGLKRYGCEVIEAVDGNEGLRTAQAMGGKVDLILSDYMMPGLNGEAFVRQVRLIPGLEEIPFILLSAVSDSSYVLNLLKAGATDYLVKPFIIEELLARISVHLKSRQLTRELRDKVEIMERLDRAKNDFLGITAHDLRSPLMSMMGYFDLMKAGVPSEEDREFFAANFESSSNHLASLIDDLDSVARHLTLEESPVLEPVNLLEIMEQCTASFLPTAKLKSIELRLLEPPKGTPGIVRGETTSLVRIFNNLISNAIKFTPRDGEVTLALEVHDGDLLRVLVKDAGVGMDPQELPRLFDPLQRQTQPGTVGERGTGLGLSIVKRLVEVQHGKLGVDTSLGMGTTFLVDFPLDDLSRKATA